MIGLGDLHAESEYDTKDKSGLHKKKLVVVVLERASLETIKTKKGYELACSDTHSAILKKLRKDAEPQNFRPDILHRCLMTLLDSPLSKSGHLKVYIHTADNTLIEVNPKIRIPRTYKRFAGLMVQLLHKLKIRATNDREVLMKVIKNPITQHLPPGALRIGTSVQSELTTMDAHVAMLPQDKPVVYVVGAHAHGPVDVNYIDRSISVSQFPLSATVVLGKLCNAYEGLWGVL